MTPAELQTNALEVLRKGTGDTAAQFRPGQFEAIQHIVERRGPLLVVQRTGWGKSNVYFIATRLMRLAGSGPALLVSPLLSLMRNQIAAAERMGLRAVRVTSEESSRAEYNQVRQEFLAGKVDILLISPERLANETFMAEMLMPVVASIGFLVIDEAHCISDWGHDFRPDYRRITRILQTLPKDVPVLATTATASDRVVDDIQSQLGAGLKIVRGWLARPSLALQTIQLPSQAARLAWLAQTLPQIPGSGIIYTLTIRDARIVAYWLKQNGLKVRPYWGGMDQEYGKPGLRELIEQRLLKNEIKAIVATTALGMGFDKPDLAFVIHYQSPGSVIHYYQQVGRAGRALENAYGVLLGGSEDDEISEYFIKTAFPSPGLVERVLRALNKSERGLPFGELAVAVGASWGQIQKSLALLALESPAPVRREDGRWRATAALLPESFWDRVGRLTALRRKEVQEMREYQRTSKCLMSFLTSALDDKSGARCSRCANCVGRPILPMTFDPILAQKAIVCLRQLDHPIPPRKMFPKGALARYKLEGRIPPELGAEEGRVMASWGDAGWGDLIKRGEYDARHFDDELVEAVAGMILRWNPKPAPAWIACVPSFDHPELMSSFAQRVARKLNLPFHDCVQKVRRTRPQKEMENSFQQAQNLDGAFEIKGGKAPAGPVVLLDDMVDSGWTFTIITAVLRGAGSGPVFPVALAQTSKSDQNRPE